MTRSVRKRVAAVCLLLCLSVPVLALDVTVGGKVGLTGPWYDGSDYDAWAVGLGLRSREPRLGFSGGLFVTIGLAQFLCFQPEVFYSQLGGRSGDDWIVLQDEANGIDLHALIKLRFTARRFRICPFAGPTLFTILGSNRILVSDRSGGTLGTLVWADGVLRVPVVGVTAGAGLEFPLGTFLWSIDVRYSRVLEPRFADATLVTHWHQNSVQLMFGIGAVLAGRPPETTRVR